MSQVLCKRVRIDQLNKGISYGYWITIGSNLAATMM